MSIIEFMFQRGLKLLAVGLALAIVLMPVGSIEKTPTSLMLISAAQITIYSLFAVLGGYLLLWRRKGLLERISLPWQALLIGTFVIGGVAGLGVMVSSWALRLEPSLGYLSLLSVLDIVWVTIFIGSSLWLAMSRFKLFQKNILIGFLSLAVVFICLWVVLRYLSIIGFTPGGGWAMDLQELWQYVIPYDLAVGAIAIVAPVLVFRLNKNKASL